MKPDIKNIVKKMPLAYGCLKILKRQYNKATQHWRQPLPYSVRIDISNECNARCPFCSRQIQPNTKPSGLIDKQVFYEIMKQVEQIPSIRSISLAAFGEPMLHPDFDEFVHYLKSKNYDIEFPTNMSLADRHFESLVLVDNIMFSIEGDDKTSYEKYRIGLNFEKTYSNIVEYDRLIKQHRTLMGGG